MQRKQRLFIYDRKEMGILILLGLLVAVFAFTLGVHLGKRVATKSLNPQDKSASLLATEEDLNPSSAQLQDHAQATRQGADEALDQAVQEEVGKTGLKLAQPRQVELPEKAKSANAGATTLGKTEDQAAAPAPEAESNGPLTAPAASSVSSANNHDARDARDARDAEEELLKGIAAVLRPAPAGKYTLQIGSHQQLQEARAQLARAEAAGLNPFMRVAEVPGKGRWYRIYVGGYPTRVRAEKAGGELRRAKSISAFIVSNAVE